MKPLLKVNFGEKHGQALSWRPTDSDILPVNSTYDKDGRIEVSNKRPKTKWSKNQPKDIKQDGKQTDK